MDPFFAYVFFASLSAMFSFFISNTYIFANTKHENNPIWKIILFVIAVTCRHST
jgi:hypothetical protein